MKAPGEPPACVVTLRLIEGMRVTLSPTADASDLTKAAKTYLSEHPELIEQAAETVRNDPHYEHSPNAKARLDTRR
jgi:hypothetical protein